MIELRNAQMFDALFSVSPMLSQIPIRAQREGNESSFQDEQGKIRKIDYEHKSVTIQRKTEDARGMTFEKFVEAAREPGTGMGKEMMRTVFQMLDKTTKETGNVVNAGGKPITLDLFLDLLEKIQIDFTPDGNPIWPSLHVGSEMHAQFQRLFPEWLKDPVFNSRMEKIVVRKRQEFYEREAHRRLVD
jgi:hypothetical protein